MDETDDSVVRCVCDATPNSTEMVSCVKCHDLIHRSCSGVEPSNCECYKAGYAFGWEEAMQARKNLETAGAAENVVRKRVFKRDRSWKCWAPVEPINVAFRKHGLRLSGDVAEYALEQCGSFLDVLAQLLWPITNAAEIDGNKIRPRITVEMSDLEQLMKIDKRFKFIKLKDERHHQKDTVRQSLMRMEGGKLAGSFKRTGDEVERTKKPLIPRASAVARFKTTIPEVARISKPFAAVLQFASVDLLEMMIVKAVELATSSGLTRVNRLQIADVIQTMGFEELLR